MIVRDDNGAKKAPTTSDYDAFAPNSLGLGQPRTQSLGFVSIIKIPVVESQEFNINKLLNFLIFCP